MSDDPRMQLRIARHTNRLIELVRFYRDGLGLVEAGGFEDHAGYSGAFLEVPGTNAHLEFTAGGEDSLPEPHPESALVLYLGDAAVVAETAGRCGGDVVPAANPYWEQVGAVTVLDPDGFRVVLVPRSWP